MGTPPLNKMFRGRLGWALPHLACRRSLKMSRRISDLGFRTSRPPSKPYGKSLVYISFSLIVVAMQRHLSFLPTQTRNLSFPLATRSLDSEYVPNPFYSCF